MASPRISPAPSPVDNGTAPAAPIAPTAAPAAPIAPTAAPAAPPVDDGIVNGRLVEGTTWLRANAKNPSWNVTRTLASASGAFNVKLTLLGFPDTRDTAGLAALAESQPTTDSDAPVKITQSKAIEANGIRADFRGSLTPGKAAELIRLT